MNEEIKQDIIQACEVMKQGGIILYPTDTVWGIGCDATNAQAVQRIFELKQRIDCKSMLVLLDDAGKIASYADVPDIAYDLLEANDKPMTIIYPNAKGLAPNLIAQDKSIGIRITQERFSHDLIFRFRKPIVSTSANISGQAAPAIFSEIAEEIKSGVDYIVRYRQNDTHRAAPSSIVKLGMNGEFELIRK